MIHATLQQNYTVICDVIISHGCVPEGGFISDEIFKELVEALSQYSDHEEEEEEEAAGSVVEAPGKKEDERVMRRSSVEGSEETKAGPVAFIRRKRRSTTEGESSAVHCAIRLCERTRGLQLEQSKQCSSVYSCHKVALPQQLLNWHCLL